MSYSLPLMVFSGMPDLALETEHLGLGASSVGGVDEVGRGALGGPVTVGVVVVDPSTPPPPAGLRDSKQLSAQRREALVPLIERWCLAFAIGHASAAEIDEVGILGALGLAGRRALAALPVAPCSIVLDGNYDWLGAARTTLRTGADGSCASVAAASVLAKVARDALMCTLARAHPIYGWEANKGYGTPSHISALTEHGPCELHRRSWRLPARSTEIVRLPALVRYNGG